MTRRFGSAGDAFERADSDIDIAIRTPDGLLLETRLALANELMDTHVRGKDEMAATCPKTVETHRERRIMYLRQN